MLSSHTTKIKTQETSMWSQPRWEETQKWWIIYGNDCDAGFEAYTYLQTHQVVYSKYVQLFVCQ
jgi:hypothetical protein